MLGPGPDATASAALTRAFGAGDRRFAAFTTRAVEAAAQAVRDDRWVTIERTDGTRLEIAALGLIHDGERWQLLCHQEHGALRAEPLDEPTTITVLPRRHSAARSFDALPAWERLRVAALR